MSNNQSPTWKVRPLRTAGSLLAWTSLALLLPVVATGCGHKTANADETTAPARPVEVNTISPVRKELTRLIEQPGFLMPWEVTPIYTKIGGFALDWKKDLGDWAKKGELLVQIDVPEEDQKLFVKKAKVKQTVADVKQAKEAAKAAKAGADAAEADIKAKAAAVETAKAEVLRWLGEVDRARTLLEKGVYDKGTYDQDVNQWRAAVAKKAETDANLLTSKATFQQASAYYNKTEADVDVAIASKDVAIADEKMQEAWLSYKYIKAPYDGLVTLRTVGEGDFIQPANAGSTSKAAEPLFIMMRINKMRCTFEVPEMDAVLLKDGDAAQIDFQAMPGTPTIGKVMRNSGSLDSHSRTLRVEVELKNPIVSHTKDNDPVFLYKPMLYAKITIRAKRPNTWMLPANVVMNDILADRDRRYCYIAEDGIVRKTFVEIGGLCEEGLPVLRKQRAGTNVWENFTGKEAIVVNGQALLDRQAVTVKASTSH